MSLEPAGRSSPSSAALAFSAAHPLLGEGDSGAPVAHARSLLDEPGSPSSDAELTAAVRQFQRAAGLGADGLIGPDTWAAMHPVLFAGSPRHDVVAEVQRALGIVADGLFGPQTAAAVKSFQAAAGVTADGIIGPLTYAELLHPELPPVATLEPSGPLWVKRFPPSSSVHDLQPPFRDAVTRFLAALAQAGVTVTVTSTLRPEARAWLMHYALAIADGDIDAAAVPSRRDIPIQWVHGDDAASVAAAQAMVDAYGILGPVALDSNHIAGHAIDMFPTWNGTPVVRNSSGAMVTLAGEPGGDNADLIAVGRSYGVVRGSGIPGDPEHWSIDGA